MPLDWRPEDRCMKTKISEVMTPWAFWIGHNQTAGTARAMMKQYGIRHLPVMEGDRVLGILNERDLSFAQAWVHADKPEFEVHEICVPEPYIVTPHRELSEVLEFMVEERCDCALVMDCGKLVGIFTATDACRVLAEVVRGGPVVGRAA
jgi:acetoin utilization protein AcuB